MIPFFILIISILLFIVYHDYTEYYTHYKERKFFIFKASGGLFHMLRALYTSCFFAKTTGRILIIDTHNHKAFNVNFNEIFYLKGLEYYTTYDIIPKHIAKVNGISISDLSKKTILFVKKNTYSFNNKILSTLKYNNNMSIIVSDNPNNNRLTANKNIPMSIKKNIHIFIKNGIMKKIKNESINGPYIGIHFRNTDISSNINIFYKNIQNAININPNINILFLATDDYTSIKLFKKRFPTKKIITLNKIKESNINNTHYLSKKVLSKYNMTKKDQIIDVLIDVYLLYKSTIFIPTEKSGISKYVLKIRCNSTSNIFTGTVP
jgi:hypothetical protein